jgi:predicted neutral ceramidase superfamily lipid hydrolase
LVWGIGAFLVIIALGILATVFWIMMIVHAARHDVENKAMWVILMVFTGIVGALIYYFVVKRKFNKQFAPPTPAMTK